MLHSNAEHGHAHSVDSVLVPVLLGQSPEYFHSSAYRCSSGSPHGSHVWIMTHDTSQEDISTSIQPSHEYLPMDPMEDMMVDGDVMVRPIAHTGTIQPALHRE